ncbi:MAG: NADH-quinone oxidoreductase subunit M [Verrucomicrobia bacterium]|nr:NADH-quinone oxidoreductase subunit M [Verrucomicrobiota bacterium]
MNSFPFLTTLTLIPLIGGVIVACLNPERKQFARRLAIVFSLAALAFAVALWFSFKADGGLQFVERAAWIPSLGIEYFLAADGLSLLMVLLAAIIIPFAMLSSAKIDKNPKLYFSLFLFLEAGLFGTFTALNFFHWFLFWELSLIPAFFLIKVWGGKERTRAAYQFFIYTMVGSVAMLLSFLAIHAATGTWDFIALAEIAGKGELKSALFAKLGGTFFESEQTLAMFIFVGVFLGFAVKVPLIPFHTWLPAAYAEAPTGTSMVLTGAMSKMGVYGFIRILLPIFPEQMREVLTPLLILAVATIVFSAFAALAQKDLKRMAAYSSINHLGYCLLGIFAAAQITGVGTDSATEKSAALSGVMLQMFNHGLTASALFCFIGLIEQRSGGLRGIDDFGGLRKVAPAFCGLLGITLFASLGLPGLNGFIGEFLIFKGTFPLVPWAAAISTVGLLVTAVLLLTILQRVFTGPLRKEWSGWTDLTSRERLTIAPVIALMFILGIFPQIVIGVINPTVLNLIKQLSL